MNNKLNEFMNKAILQSYLSSDAQTKVGCVLLSRKDRNIVMKAHNSFIDVRLNNKLPNTRPGKYTYIQHAEQRLLYRCARNGIKTNYGILVSTHSPCVSCALSLFQAGINTIYCDVMRPETEMINDRLDLKVTLRKLKTGVYKLKLSLRS